MPFKLEYHDQNQATVSSNGGAFSGDLVERRVKDEW